MGKAFYSLFVYLCRRGGAPAYSGACRRPQRRLSSTTVHINKIIKLILQSTRPLVSPRLLCRLEATGEGGGERKAFLFTRMSSLAPKHRPRSVAPWGKLSSQSHLPIRTSNFRNSTDRTWTVPSPKKSPKVHPSIRFDLAESLRAR